MVSYRFISDNLEENCFQRKTLSYLEFYKNFWSSLYKGQRSQLTMDSLLFTSHIALHLLNVRQELSFYCSYTIYCRSAPKARKEVNLWVLFLESLNQYYLKTINLECETLEFKSNSILPQNLGLKQGTEFYDSEHEFQNQTA